MLARLFLFCVIFPLVELTLLLLLGKYTSVTTVVLFVVITGLLGTVMLRWQGLAALRKIQDDLRNRRMPTDSLMDGALVVLASVLLILPGVLTDVVGITLLIPPLRPRYRRFVVWYFQARVVSKFTQQGAPPNSGRTEVIDSYIVDNIPGKSDSAD
ncbi:FxsA family protein [Anatilimnocola floriformis]|uniref:FxsA family protein n=1 Tax=Anatilimnocola floriformis TaxID=2948575 RepID=UPI0020C50731|nr:FxsA family protein [Anatilimnocola floriformis]